MSDIKSRLIEFATSQGFKSFASFEKACGLPQSTLQKIGDSASTITLNRIVEKFQSLNLDWLIIGRGNMTVEESPRTETDIMPSVNIETINTVNIGNWDVLGEIVHKAISSALKNNK